jgi:hypothetical protein
MAHALVFWLLLVATLMSGLLAGISLDKSFVQLPARGRIGLAAYAAYSRAADLGGGLIWYPLLGLGAPLLAVVAAAVVGWQGVSVTQALPVYLSALLGVAHVATTVRAAPLLLRVHRTGPDEPTMQTLFQRFVFWQGVRFVVQGATFAALLWALLAYTR